MTSRMLDTKDGLVDGWMGSVRQSNIHVRVQQHTCACSTTYMCVSCIAFDGLNK